MKVVNTKNNHIISEKLKVVTSFSDQLFGLLKRSNPRSLLFKTRFGIHTFFLKEAIDVIVLDRDFKVVKLAQVKPNKLFFWNPKYFYVLELPKGVIGKTNTKTGDSLQII